MNDELSDILKEIGLVILPSLFEPHVSFYPKVKKELPSLMKHLRSGSGKPYKLPKTIVRNRFLYNCLRFTKDETIEHLIIGYGRMRSSTTDVEMVQHVIGDATSVTIPRIVQNNLETWYERDCRNEVVVFHNHPPGSFHSLISRVPVASTADRTVTLFEKLTPYYIIRSFFKGGGIRFFLSENRDVTEVTLPAVPQAIAILRSLNLLPEKG